jgi:hypothetical protein
MTRPATLCEAAERIVHGQQRDKALAEFLDSFYVETSTAARLAMLQTEPPFTGDARTDALFGAVGEYLAKQFRLGHVPHWVADKRRVLDEPWFTAGSDSDAMREYLTVSTPAEFLHRNIFTEPMPLRRARDPRGRTGGAADNG